MFTLTLCSKVYNNFQLKYTGKYLLSTLRGLKVKIKVCGVTSRGWVQIAVSGEDEKVALPFLASEVGLCPTSLEEISKFSTTKGCVTVIDRDAIYLDIGIFSPKIIDVPIRLRHLQAQLADGRRIALEKIVELFGLCKNLPLTIKILSVNKSSSQIEATLSEDQLVQYRGWTKSLLDRLIIIGASFEEVRTVLKKLSLNRDIVNLQPLGLFEHAVICKIGTDATGLIPKIGRNLRNATLTVFNPRKILEFFDYFLSI